jgi:hypothetical protein
LRSGNLLLVEDQIRGQPQGSQGEQPQSGQGETPAEQAGNGQQGWGEKARRHWIALKENGFRPHQPTRPMPASPRAGSTQQNGGSAPKSNAARVTTARSRRRSTADRTRAIIPNAARRVNSVLCLRLDSR